PIRTKNRQVPDVFADLVHRLLAKRPEDRFASAIEVAYALEPWRTHEEQPLDTPDDPEFKRAVQNLVDSWVAPEPAKEAEQAIEGAVFFRIEPENQEAPAEFLARSIFREVDRVPPHFWVLGIVGVWLAVLFLCVMGSCLFTLLR